DYYCCSYASSSTWVF
nr:immunoglobulin light chain junction region [Macaca mulatta]MOW29849.1 immunoglobulin light chain junction region [Macaca mulatta]